MSNERSRKGVEALWAGAGLASGPVAATLMLLAIGVVSWWGVLSPWWNWHVRNEEAIEEHTHILRRLDAQIELKNSRSVSLKSANVATFARNFLAGSNDAVVLAELQTKLRSLVLSHKVEFNSALALPPVTEGGITYLGLKLQLRGELKDIHQIVYSIETQSPFLFIERAHVRPSEQRLIVRKGRESGAVARLSAELDVYGAKWPGTSLRTNPVTDQ
jgi:hypothetical protein